MSKKCVAFSKSKIGLEIPNNRKAFYAGWDAALAEQAVEPDQEPVGVVEGSGEWGIAGVLVAGVPIGTKLYTNPVRTKDLTDDEIDEIGKSYFDEWSFGFARAVIAADREKNK